MVKKYSDLYLQARRALLPSEGENASMAARELLAFASGKSVTAVLADSNLYASESDGGYLCFEFGLGQHMAVSMILQEYGYTDIVLRKDLRGVVRAVRGKKK